MEIDCKPKRDSHTYPFYDILEIFQASSSPNLILKKAVEEIPALFFIHGKVSALVIWKDQAFISSGFDTRGRKITSDIIVHGQKEGVIEIFFNKVQINIEKWNRHSFPPRDSSVLLDQISRMIGKFLAKEHLIDYLATSEKNIRNVFDNLQDHIFILDLEGNILDCNKQATDCLNFGCGQISGLKLKDTGYLNAQTVDRIIEHTLFDGAFTVETECSCADDVIIVRIDASCIDYNEREAILCIVRDISQIKEYEMDLKRYAEEFKNSGELKELFTDIICHDLLTPAGIIKGFTEELICNPSSEEKDLSLRKIYENINRLIELLDSATKLSKLQRVEEILFEDIDIVPLFLMVVENLKTDADGKRQEIVISKGLKCPSKVNPIIEEVFANLLSNAIKYSPDESRINIDFLDENRHWKVVVKDCGNGISDMDKAFIFDRFHRADKKGIKGSGLGLAIVKRITELHGGDYGIEDNPEGQGSIFWVTVKKAY
ncbi:MAG: PAS domain-containing sensor histidine kinase [Methanolobus sp.]|nr:PAS domain-containing sensor histidine kinase [Methanolobus sp.]